MQDIFVRMRRQLSSLSKAERRVAEAVLDDPALATRSTITRLAAACGTSGATVARLCRSMGFRGYPEFRLAIASAVSRDEASREHFRIDDADIGSDDSAREVVTKVAYRGAKSVEDTARHLDVAALDAAARALGDARRIEIYGVGQSGVAALDLEQKLQRIGCPAWSTADPHRALTRVAQAGAGDVFVGISHSGETPETREVIALAREHGATTLAITNVPRSPVGRAAELVLATSASESVYRMMSSGIAQLAVVDFLMARLLQRAYPDASESLEGAYRALRRHNAREATGADDD
ncbi:MurR/RpiR family transcriptional regulator [Microbacterium suaedae]|uniref:MurR/RpiR family transcriptional regulator n=1 Tax=Microbacterium suaedae TaxID=2067813 RepID=UPI000DA13C2E|nr:MurR/RpiR family transcriptional regulator [Microbacterium suaedae]